jgi:hypothetical protein
MRVHAPLSTTMRRAARASTPPLVRAGGVHAQQLDDAHQDGQTRLRADVALVTTAERVVVVEGHDPERDDGHEVDNEL